MSMDKQTLGLINGIVSGISFGLIPLFSIPVIAAGMGNVSILVYRFLFGSLAMLGMLLLKKTDLRVSLSEIWRIAILSLFYIGTALATLECYHYLSSGIATALVYTDPIWCAIIGLIFLGDRFSLKLTSSCLFATLGVMMMTGVFTEDGTFSALGLFLRLVSHFRPKTTPQAHTKSKAHVLCVFHRNAYTCRIRHPEGRNH